MIASVQYCRCRHGDEVAWGRVIGKEVELLDAAPWDGPSVVGRAVRGEVTLLAPCIPSKIICLGVNYRAHATEFGHELPAAPLIFLKPPSAVIGPDDAIIYPPQWTRQVDYEAELAVVIGQRARHVAEETALDHVFGYTCLNDVTARDLQRADGQWTRGKSFDTFCPIGPVIVCGLDPGALRVASYVNGEVRQDASTADLIFGVPAIVAFVSHVMTLEPGDVIATGTPSGVGPLVPGDVVEIEVEGIGRLRNHVERG
jgi:2-keto-4-pentenoate hydratase/2-oxohepta-3-ene-1,7-dioic acid hydratase in catechol pathway